MTTTQVVTLTDTGTWTVPSNIASDIQAEAVGNGAGSGNGSNFNEGGGGGGGAYAALTFTGTAGNVYTGTVPAAAAGASGTASAGQTGGDVTLQAPGGTTILKAAGGHGTAAYNPAGGTGGQATDCIGTTKTSGSDGETGTGAGVGLGGDAAPPLGGSGGAQATDGGLPGEFPGGGASGAHIGPANPGAPGARGVIVLTYEVSEETSTPTAKFKNSAGTIIEGSVYSKETIVVVPATSIGYKDSSGTFTTL